jgi:hypothetical protein
MKRHFYLPTRDEPGNDLCRLVGLIRRKQSLWSKLALGITNEHLAHYNRWQPPMVPHGRSGGHLDRACQSCIPRNGERLPGCFGSKQAIGQSGLTCSFQAGSSLGLCCALGSWVIQSRIQPQARHHRDRLTQGYRTPLQLQHRITAIGHYDQIPVGQPAAQLADHLSSPVGDLLVPSLALFIIAF